MQHRWQYSAAKLRNRLLAASAKFILFGYILVLAQVWYKTGIY
jgi:hypothetical protein